MPHQSKPYSTWRQLLWHWMMGTALGILCAGVLLTSHAPELQPLFAGPADAFLRLMFLVLIGASFGMCATVTGALFLASEKK